MMVLQEHFRSERLPQGTRVTSFRSPLTIYQHDYPYRNSQPAKSSQKSCRRPSMEQEGGAGSRKAVSLQCTETKEI